MLKVDAFPMTVMFGMCSVFLFVASMLQRRLMNVAEIHKSSKSSDITHEMVERELKVKWHTRLIGS